MLSRIRIAAGLWVALLLITACKRNYGVPEINSTSTQLEIDRLRNERDAKIDELRDQSAEQAARIAELNLERDELSETRERLDTDIRLLNQQLETAELTATQKLELERRLAALNEEKATTATRLTQNETQLKQALDTITNLNQEVTQLKAEITRLQSRITELEQQLAAERARNATPSQPALPGASAPATPAQPAAPAASFISFRVPGETNCLALPPAAANGSQLVKTPCFAVTQQQFTAPAVAGSTAVRLISRSSAMCVGLGTSTAGVSNTPVVQETCSTTALDQQWEFVSSTNPSMQRLRNRASNKCIKIMADGRLADGDCVLDSNLLMRTTAG